MGLDTAGKTTIGIQSAGAVFSTLAAYNKSRAEKAAYEYNAQVARNNAQLSGVGAEDALMRGQTAEQTQRLKTANLKGSQRASLAARGLSLDEGSALDILTSTDYMGERDALTVRDNAAREAWALREEGKNHMANAALLSFRARSENPLMSAAGTLLTGAGQVASSWYAFKKSGVKGFE